MSRTIKEKTAPPVVEWEKLRPEVTNELLAEMTRRIVEAFHPHKVILFGSYAYGTPHKDSDVDIFIIMDSDERPVKRRMKVSDVAHVRFLPMDILVYTPDEIVKRLEIGDFFVKEILEKGRVLYSDGSC